MPSPALSLSFHLSTALADSPSTCVSPIMSSQNPVGAPPRGQMIGWFFILDAGAKIRKENPGSSGRGCWTFDPRGLVGSSEVLHYQCDLQDKIVQFAIVFDTRTHKVWSEVTVNNRMIGKTPELLASKFPRLATGKLAQLLTHVSTFADHR